MFDPTKTLSIQLIREQGDVSFICPWPTDEQLTERSRTRKILGGGASDAAIEEADAKNRKNDLDWLKKLAPESVDIDEYEASYVCAQMLNVDVIDVSRVAGQIEMTLETPFGAIPVAVRIPSRPAIAEYERTVIAKRDVRGVREITMRLEAGAKLYDAIAEGPKVLPVIYKVAVCGAVVNYLDNLRGATVNP